MGSSPLTRGKLRCQATTPARVGLIPAHAGKTLMRFAVRRSSWAHPRSRGENLSDLFVDAAAQGSSPLTRGKLWMVYPSVRGRGLIPAHAGKTEATDHAASSGRAHPRSRGENVRQGHVRLGGPGSSPLTRGKLPTLPTSQHVRGLIPAHAGKTGTGAGEVVTLGAHPRSRGENWNGGKRHDGQAGSSPLTRGKLLFQG